MAGQGGHAGPLAAVAAPPCAAYCIHACTGARAAAPCRTQSAVRGNAASPLAWRLTSVPRVSAPCLMQYDGFEMLYEETMSVLDPIVAQATGGYTYNSTTCGDKCLVWTDGGPRGSVSTGRKCVRGCGRSCVRACVRSTRLLPQQAARCSRMLSCCDARKALRPPGGGGGGAGARARAQPLPSQHSNALRCWSSSAARRWNGCCVAVRLCGAEPVATAPPSPCLAFPCLPFPASAAGCGRGSCAAWKATTSTPSASCSTSTAPVSTPAQAPPRPSPARLSPKHTRTHIQCTCMAEGISASLINANLGSHGPLPPSTPLLPVLPTCNVHGALATRAARDAWRSPTPAGH